MFRCRPPVLMGRLARSPSWSTFRCRRFWPPSTSRARSRRSSRPVKIPSRWRSQRRKKWFRCRMYRKLMKISNPTGTARSLLWMRFRLKRVSRWMKVRRWWLRNRGNRNELLWSRRRKIPRRNRNRRINLVPAGVVRAANIEPVARMSQNRAKTGPAKRSLSGKVAVPVVAIGSTHRPRGKMKRSNRLLIRRRLARRSKAV